MEHLLPQPAERRPAAETVNELRASCDAVLARESFAATFGVRIAELVPVGHPLRAPEIPLADLAVAVLDPVRDPDRYGGAVDHVEARWQQLGAWLCELGMPDDAGHHLVRAVARAARDVSGEEWDSGASSAWAALQMWMQQQLDAGVERARGPRPPAAPQPGPQEPSPEPSTLSPLAPLGASPFAAVRAASAGAPDLRTSG